MEKVFTILALALLTLFVLAITFVLFGSVHDSLICYKRTGLYDGCNIKERVQTNKVILSKE